MPYQNCGLVRNEEAGGSNPLSSTNFSITYIAFRLPFFHLGQRNGAESRLRAEAHSRLAQRDLALVWAARCRPTHGLRMLSIAIDVILEIARTNAKQDGPGCGAAQLVALQDVENAAAL